MSAKPTSVEHRIHVAAGTTIHLPPHGLTLPVLEHPDSDQVVPQVNDADWPFILDLFGSRKAAEAYFAYNMPVYGALCCPHGRADRIFSVAQAMDLMTLMDDEFSRPEVLASEETAGELRIHYLAALDGVEPPGNFPIARLLWLHLRTIGRDINPRVDARLKQAISERVESLASGNRPTIQSFADIEMYLAFRRTDIFADWANILIAEYGIDVDMTNALQDPDLRHAVERSLNTIVLANDLYSLSREISARDSLNVIWLLLRDEPELSLQDAVKKLVEILDDMERQFLAARDKVAAGPIGHREDVRRYLTEVGHFSSGNAEFHLRSLRYHGRPDGEIFTSGEIAVGTSPTIYQIAAAHPGK
ncbi:terpene synthase family protein [Saccharopolyspora sp. 5N708]|uniref:terpene synthase family protein n=1 Tax=Saccharopolyspora sp. 5N708 TaxID=3457424 RepID=UPI003FD208D1